MGPAGLGRRHAPSEPATRTEAGRADRQLPHAGRGGVAGRRRSWRWRRPASRRPGRSASPGRRPASCRVPRRRCPARVAQVAREEMAAVAPGPRRRPRTGRHAARAHPRPGRRRARSRSIRATPTGDGLGRRPGRAAGRRDQRPRVRLGRRRRAVVGRGGGRRPAGEGPPVATTRGLRTLYVAFTRPTKRLTVVHAEPLPVDLG